MNRKGMLGAWLCIFMAAAMNGQAVMIKLEGISGSASTGDLFEGVGPQWATNAVLEVSNLELRARTHATDHVLNANVGYFGINSDLAGEDSRAFDVGEQMQLSFSEPVRINGFDFNLFDDAESFEIIAGGVTNRIDYADLSNQSTDICDTADLTETDPSDWIFAADEVILMQAEAGSIGLDGLDLEVIPEPMTASLVALVGIGVLTARRFRMDG